MTKASFYELVKGPRCDHVREAATDLLAELENIEALIVKILAMDPPGLPQQQIHADCHTSNILVHDGVVTGLLDFEFSAPDWTAMELVSTTTAFLFAHHR